MSGKILKCVLFFCLLIVITLPIMNQEKTMKKPDIKKIEKERVEFKKLILKNPNYFGNIADEAIVAKFKPQLEMMNNTKYEALKCVGLYPEDNLLEAVIEVKLPYGFKGALCSEGSKEYVSFYIDYNDGAGFVSVGAPAEVNVHDISFVNGGHLFYAVRKPFIPEKYIKCNSPQIVKVRAILSWEALPTGPNFNPVWGNVFDVWAQIKPKKPVIIIEPGYVMKTMDEYELIKPLPEQAIIPIDTPPYEKLIMIGDKREIKNLIDRSIQAEEKIREKGIVEKERTEFKDIIRKNINYFGSITESKDPDKILNTIYELPPKTIKAMLPEIIDPSELVPVVPLLQKTKYEELICAGLYPEDDLLEAIIEVKLPYGFIGDLCTLGSKEYVAFYIDWGTGIYVYAASASVRVHDIPEVSEKHLFYAVKAKIPNIEARLKTCNQENIVKVKAILSWNHDPTPYGPSYKPTWGNTITRNVQIRPKDGISAKCDIEIINKVHIDDISQSGTAEGLAAKINAQNNTVPGTYDRPFGGMIACWGNINIPGAKYYRFSYSEDGGISWTAIKDPRRARNVFGYTILRSPDSDGWFSKNQYNTDVANYSLTALVHWRSHGKNGKYRMKLELADGAKNPISGQTFECSIFLDNVRPELLKFGGTPTPLPAIGVVVKDDSGTYRKCGTFVGDENIRIFGNFRDDYFLSYRLKIFGGNIAVSGVNIDISALGDGKGRYDSGIPVVGPTGVIGAVDGGLGQEIGSLNLCTIPQSPSKVKCAYGIELTIWGRSIVGHVSGYEFNTSHHRINAFVTFDWDPEGCN